MSSKDIEYGMVIDLDRCTGCRGCIEICKIENNTPQGIFWMHVFRFEKNKFPNTRIWFIPRPCMHCEDPACVKVCPFGATYKDDKDRTMQNAERCIGCRYCMQACPYGVRSFNYKIPAKNQYMDWQGEEFAAIKSAIGDANPPYQNPDLDLEYRLGQEGSLEDKAKIAGGGKLTGVVEKCTFCVQRVENGKLPACVANCPTKTLTFGNLKDPKSEVSKILAKNPSYTLLPDMGTHPHVYYVGQSPPDEKTRTIEPINEEVKFYRT